MELPPVLWVEAWPYANQRPNPISINKGARKFLAAENVPYDPNIPVETKKLLGQPYSEQQAMNKALT